VGGTEFALQTGESSALLRAKQQAPELQNTFVSLSLSFLSTVPISICFHSESIKINGYLFPRTTFRTWSQQPRYILHLEALRSTAPNNRGKAPGGKRTSLVMPTNTTL
jgi:hypothetical protein